MRIQRTTLTVAALVASLTAIGVGPAFAGGAPPNPLSTPSASTGLTPAVPAPGAKESADEVSADEMRLAATNKLISYYNSNYVGANGYVSSNVSNWLNWVYPNNGTGQGETIYHNNGSNWNNGSSDASMWTGTSRTGNGFAIDDGESYSGSIGLGSLYNGIGSSYYGS